MMERLLNQHWIIKKDDPKTYYEIKALIKKHKKILNEKLGYTILENQYLVKLEKIPGKAENWMGIQAFQSILEYQMFLCIIMYLEDKEMEFQFVLSQLSEYVQMQFHEGEIDWTVYATRKRFVRVLKFCINQSLILLNDGDDERFIQDENVEALYENTGYSRYYMRHFNRDVMDYQNVDDFMQSEWFDMDEDRGLLRRQRVYRRLLLSAGIYRSQDDNQEDFAYLRNYRYQVEQDFQALFPSRVDLYKSSAYLILEDEARLKNVFPARNMLDDMILHVHVELRKAIDSNIFTVDDYEHLNIHIKNLNHIVETIIESKFEQLSKTFRERARQDIINEIIKGMETYGFIKIVDETVTCYPIIGKISGEYEGGIEDVNK